MKATNSCRPDDAVHDILSDNSFDSGVNPRKQARKDQTNRVNNRRAVMSERFNSSMGILPMFLGCVNS
jgi:hypothetical protein